MTFENNFTEPFRHCYRLILESFCYPTSTTKETSSPFLLQPNSQPEATAPPPLVSTVCLSRRFICESDSRGSCAWLPASPKSDFLSCCSSQLFVPLCC